MYSKYKKVWNLLDKKNKNKFFVLLIFALFSSIFDLLSVVSILPFLSVLTEPELIKTNIYLIKLNSYLNFEFKEFIIFLGLGSFILIVINQSLRLFSRLYSIAFARNLIFEKSRDLFDYYLNRSYKFFLSQSNVHLIQKCTAYVEAVISGFVTPFLLIFAQLSTATLIVIFMLIYQPLITLGTTIVLALFYFTIYKKISHKVSEIGKINPKYFSFASRALGDAFRTIKQLKLTKNSNFFQSRFLRAAIKYRNSNVSYNFFSGTPGFLIEIIAYGLILSVSLFLFFSEDDFKNIIPLMGVLVLSLRKLIPAAQDIFQQIIQIKFHKGTYDKIIDDLEGSSQYRKYKSSGLSRRTLNINFNKKIEMKNLIFSYNSHSNRVLSISGKIKKGQFIGICGKSGHGKTTFLNIFCGLLNQTHGKILIDGVELEKKNIDSWQSKIGYVSQDGYIINDTVQNNILFGERKEKDYIKIKKVCKIAEISSFIEKKLKNKYNSRLGEGGTQLSGGQQQRLLIARSLYQDPEIIIFDEATNELDNITENKILKSLRKIYKSRTFLFVTHRINTLKNCDDILFFENGKIRLSGKYNEIRKKDKKFYDLIKFYEDKYR